MCIPNLSNFKVSEIRNRLLKDGKISVDDALDLQERTDNLLTIVVILTGFSLFAAGLLVGYVIGRM